MDGNDVRVTAPICTPADVATHVDMPRSTVYSWMKATPTRPALIHSVEPAVRGWPTIPLLGLAEASVLRALRDSHMKMSEIAAAVTYLRETEGEYALGSPQLVHDGVSALLRDNEGLRTLIGGQGVLLDAVSEQLQPFRLAPDGFVQAFMVKKLRGVEMDPRFSSGRMRFTRTGVPLFAVAGQLVGGEEESIVRSEYGLTLDELRTVREHLPWISEVA